MIGACKALNFIQKNWLILCLLVLSAYLSLYRIDDCHIWMDEFFSIHVANRTLSEIWSLEQHPNGFYFNRFPPLYETVLHCFWRPSGNNLLAARSVSITFNLIALYFIFLIAELLFDRQTGFIAMFLAAINYAYIFFSKMIRGYSFLNCLTLISFYLFF